MKLLEKTTYYIAHRPMMHKQCEPYAGPQCYPEYVQLVSSPKPKRETPAAGALDAAALEDNNAPFERQLKCGWKTCQACGKRRLVDLECLPALSSEEFNKRPVGEHGTNWEQWLRDAPASPFLALALCAV